MTRTIWREWTDAGRGASAEERMKPVKDWVDWHRGYDDPSSSISARLERVRLHLADAISQAPPRPVQILSLCAGQGHDVLGVLPDHPRRKDVRALLVEFDSHNAAVARDRAAQAGLTQVEVREADAGDVTSFADVLPADVLLLCGIFGNVGDADIRRTVEAAPALCADGATVIWTRHRRAPDLTPQLRAWFAAGGFDEVAFDALDTEKLTTVGVHRLRNRPAAALAGPLFTFGS
jgi:Putative methyltransferase